MSNITNSVYLVLHRDWGGDKIYKICKTKKDANYYIKKEHPKNSYVNPKELSIVEWSVTHY